MLSGWESFPGSLFASDLHGRLRPGNEVPGGRYLERVHKLVLCDDFAILQLLKAAVVLVDQHVQLYQII